MIPEGLTSSSRCERTKPETGGAPRTTTTGHAGVLRQGVDALAARGTLVVVGAPPFGTEVALDVNGLLGGKRIVGLTFGDSETRTMIPALVHLLKDGRLPLHRLISTHPFEDIDRAVQDMRSARRSSRS
ncbi:hypothetical protein GCM10017668_04770 [Streptomyces tuirus]|uniref:Alcohol dehydrogenase-like C-terminal domain-containing protein n=1 Tax=Streptomyces tuirus TaxID=68278 RepID=A0A7G1NAP6_9ACTN|nr:hypothetical protein GCM10017668_04770 [Streptomyces tuirus]